jgi:outer membrane biosynthesis protein TonB
MPDPAIAPEFEDLDQDGIPDDNNANGVPDWEEPLPEAPVAEEPAPAPEAPAPAEEAPAQAPAPEDQESESEQAPEEEAASEPLFEGSASLDLDGGGLRATGEATARISDIPFEGEALGRQEQR